MTRYTSTMNKFWLLFIGLLAIIGILGFLANDTVDPGQPPELYPEEVLPRGDAL